MPVSIPGNLTYINQNAPYSSIVNQNALPKISQIDQQVFLERLQKVEATRALEENKAVSPDKEEPPTIPPIKGNKNRKSKAPPKRTPMTVANKARTRNIATTGIITATAS
ncbi:hypothetical protein ASB1_09520 [Helicobacter heilmannii]|uniref:hypothetical protein n=1 Tax=Helicobacter heilmannii TaxID=35817 RepID=UPI00220CD8CE|nr:hypothetical protein [Helicobacter heilmannii]BDQ27276.1 hypothetical protein ASB1_09520 [Helicobacter heilmannii]